MKIRNTLLALFAVCSLATGIVLAADAPKDAPAAPHKAGCCTKADKAGKTCDHECCVAAAKEHKNCEKCGGTNEKK